MLNILDEMNFDGWISVELDSYPDSKKGAELSCQFFSKFEKINNV